MSWQQSGRSLALAARNFPLIALGYDENHKPRAARFPAADAALVAKAAQLMDLRVYEAASEAWPPLPKKSCRRAGCTATAAALCPTSGKACTARSSRRSRSSHRPRSAKPRRAAGRDWPTADLGRHRAWPSRPRSGIPRLRVVGSDRDRSHRRYVHVAVSGLPEAAQVCSPSDRNRVDEPFRLNNEGRQPRRPSRHRGRCLPRPDQNPPHRLAHLRRRQPLAIRRHAALASTRTSQLVNSRKRGGVAHAWQWRLQQQQRQRRRKRERK